MFHVPAENPPGLLAFASKNPGISVKANKILGNLKSAGITTGCLGNPENPGITSACLGNPENPPELLVLVSKTCQNMENMET